MVLLGRLKAIVLRYALPSTVKLSVLSLTEREVPLAVVTVTEVPLIVETERGTPLTVPTLITSYN